MLKELAEIMGCENASSAAESFGTLVDSLGLSAPKAADGDIDILVSSVNAERLKNHPVQLDSDTIRALYKKIVL